MGSDPEKVEDAFDWEQPQHKVDLPEFYIGKYPITNAQYEAFVQSTGRSALKHWANDQAPSGKANHPVVYVSWRDALAFCEWLSKETGKAVRLPSEAEWEKAARGTDGRIYPWGDKSPTDDLCNFSTNVGDTTPVGTYSPQGDSPYGCVDMAGNVREWTRSLKKSYPYDSTDGREDPDAKGGRVLRGGSWDPVRRIVRCAYRRRGFPDDFFGPYFGFRVVVSLGAFES
jgi:formylglycine-generating enzyme required for sulfatase activity